MSVEPEIDSNYINMLRRRELHHAEKRLEFFDAARESVDDPARVNSLLERSEYHRGYRESIAYIIVELVEPEMRMESEQS